MNHRIRQEITVSASPKTVFAALTDAARFSEMSGRPAQIDPAPGGAFSLFGAMIEGRTIEAVDDERLVQAWRAANWEPGVYSLVSFHLSNEGDATRIVLEHSSFPEGQAEHLDKGWHLNYWEPLAKLVGASPT